jgi:hypothetical protein
MSGLARNLRGTSNTQRLMFVNDRPDSSQVAYISSVVGINDMKFKLDLHFSICLAFSCLDSLFFPAS